MKFLFGRSFLQVLFRKMYHYSLKGMNYNLVGSGEKNVLKKVLAGTEDTEVVIIDAGANVGQFANMALSLISEKGRVYSFEPAADTFQKLEANIKDSRVIKVNKGLGDEEKQIVLYSSQPGSTIASVFQRNISGELQTDHETIQITTLDLFADKLNLEYIHFLKVDVEGADLDVLKGAKRLLKNRKIKFIQFEFGGTQIAPRVFLRDFYELLEKDYSLYWVLSDGLQNIEQYSEHYEIFSYANYLAILKDR